MTAGVPGVHHPGLFYAPQFMVWAYLRGWGVELMKTRQAMVGGVDRNEKDTI